MHDFIKQKTHIQTEKGNKRFYLPIKVVITKNNVTSHCVCCAWRAPLKEHLIPCSIFTGPTTCWCLRFHSSNWSTMQTAEQCMLQSGPWPQVAGIQIKGERWRRGEAGYKGESGGTVLQLQLFWLMIVLCSFHKSHPIWHRGHHSIFRSKTPPTLHHPPLTQMLKLFQKL